MRPTSSAPAHLVCLAAALSLALLLAGCAAAGAPTAVPTAETAAAPAADATPEPTLPASPTPPPTHAAPPTPASTVPTPQPVAAALVTLREDAVYLGDGWGAGAEQVLSLGGASSVALQGSRLAYVVGGRVLLADLRSGEPQPISDAPPAFLLGPELVWTDDGQALLTIADREDETASETGRRLDIGVVTLADGTWRPGLVLADRAGATILRAEGAQASVLLVAWGGEPTFGEALRYDLATGQQLATLQIAGQGEIAPAPGGHLAATTLFDPASELTSILVYDLAQDSAPVAYRMPLPAGSHAAGLTWSPDGRRLSYLLREGRAPGEAPGRGRGIWLWELGQDEATQVVEASDPLSGPAAWTPDGRYLIYRLVDAAGAAAYYALDTADGTARRLPLDPDSRILGWVE